MKILKLHPKNPEKSRQMSRTVRKVNVSAAEAAAEEQSRGNPLKIFTILETLSVQGNSVFERIRIRMEAAKKNSLAFSPADLDFIGPGDQAAYFIKERGGK
ncbi:hypothetical protein [Peribacillus deserti]|uniref:Uncharacterized protein n=1 Tax=Peribacillus deserti TaxID=673318 RepID=A0A2N5M4X9_9BACI|nr:hypothetical protein [Peribacillus deserti]PLT29407.1 hypothetical protein CUU66_13360 [Peribacillus deserti]